MSKCHDHCIGGALHEVIRGHEPVPQEFLDQDLNEATVPLCCVEYLANHADEIDRRIDAHDDLVAALIGLLPLLAQMVGTGVARGHTIPPEMTNAIRKGVAAVVAASDDHTTIQLATDIGQVLDGIDKPEEASP